MKAHDKRDIFKTVVARLNDCKTELKDITEDPDDSQCKDVSSFKNMFNDMIDDATWYMNHYEKIADACCKSCEKELDQRWIHCPFCGTKRAA